MPLWVGVPRVCRRVYPRVGGVTRRIVGSLPWWEVYYPGIYAS